MTHEQGERGRSGSVNAEDKTRAEAIGLFSAALNTKLTDLQVLARYEGVGYTEIAREEVAFLLREIAALADEYDAKGAPVRGRVSGGDYYVDDPRGPGYVLPPTSSLPSQDGRYQALGLFQGVESRLLTSTAAPVIVLGLDPLVQGDSKVTEYYDQIPGEWRMRQPFDFWGSDKALQRSGILDRRVWLPITGVNTLIFDTDYLVGDVNAADHPSHIAQSLRTGMDGSLLEADRRFEE